MNMIAICAYFDKGNLVTEGDTQTNIAQRIVN